MKKTQNSQNTIAVWERGLNYKTGVPRDMQEYGEHKGADRLGEKYKAKSNEDQKNK